MSTDFGFITLSHVIDKSLNILILDIDDKYNICICIQGNPYYNQTQIFININIFDSFE